MFCLNCGKRLTDRAKYCPECEQGLATGIWPARDTPPAPPHLPGLLPSPFYVYCEINFKVKRAGGIFNRPGTGYFYCNASTTFNDTSIMKSDLFSLTADKQPWMDRNPNDRRGQECIAALENLTERLKTNGWEFVETIGPQTWKRRFKRPVIIIVEGVDPLNKG